MKKVGICYSKDLKGNSPLSHIVTKLPVYLRLLDMISESGWEPYILTRKTYKGGRVFAGGWLYKNGKFILIKKDIEIDLVYDKTGGIDFPPEGEDLKVINPRNFKILCWDKWATYKEIGEYMPKTILIENEKQIGLTLSKINSDTVVLKPFNGLKGLGIYIGDKNGAANFKFPKTFSKYILQEFVDTSGGIPNITSGMHDLRIVIVNGKAVWCHVRVPKKGSFTANAAQGGNLTEVNYDLVPESIKEIVEKVVALFSEKFGNTIYSLDFGVNKAGKPMLFEINDQMGFPKWEMKNRDTFLNELISAFRQSLQ